MTHSVPLIPRAALFGNPEKAGAQISPDGVHLTWRAPLDGVMNVFIAPRGNVSAARPLTRETGRPVQNYAWAKDSRHVLVYKDKEGDENWHIHAIDITTGAARDLTPHDGVNAGIARFSSKNPDSVLITHNKRDPRFPDLFRIDIAMGAETTLAENPGFAGFSADDDFTVRLAARMNADGSLTTMRPDGAGGWTEWLHLPAEDVLASGVSDDFSPDGKSVLMLSSQNRDTAALLRLDLETGDTALLAEDDRADIGGLIIDETTKQPLAYSVNYDRLRYAALDPAIQPDLDFLAAAGIGDWTLSSRTDDDTLWVIGAQSDTARVRPICMIGRKKRWKNSMTRGRCWPMRRWRRCTRKSSNRGTVSI